MATVAQRVNEMEFALRGMGIPSEVRDHLDLKAHADPTLSAKENVANFLDTHALSEYEMHGLSVRELREMEREAEQEGLESEVQRRLDERIAEVVAEVKAEGCAECNAQLRAIEARLKKTPRGQGLKKNGRSNRSVAKKARTAAQKRADAAASRRMKGKRPSFMRKRRARKAAKASRPRRRYRSMGRKSKRSGPKQKAPVVRTLAKVGAFLGGLKLIADNDPKGFAQYVVANPKALLDPNLYAQALARFGPGGLLIYGGPKLVDGLYSVAPPEMKRLKASPNRKWV